MSSLEMRPASFCLASYILSLTHSVCLVISDPVCLSQPHHFHRSVSGGLLLSFNTCVFNVVIELDCPHQESRFSCH